MSANLFVRFMQTFCSCFKPSSAETPTSDDDDIQVRTTILCCMCTDSVTVTDDDGNLKKRIETDVYKDLSDYETTTSSNGCTIEVPL